MLFFVEQFSNTIIIMAGTPAISFRAFADGNDPPEFAQGLTSVGPNLQTANLMVANNMVVRGTITGDIGLGALTDTDATAADFDFDVSLNNQLAIGNNSNPTSPALTTSKIFVGTGAGQGGVDIGRPSGNPTQIQGPLSITNAGLPTQTTMAAVNVQRSALVVQGDNAGAVSKLQLNGGPGGTGTTNDDGFYAAHVTAIATISLNITNAFWAFQQIGNNVRIEGTIAVTANVSSNSFYFIITPARLKPTPPPTFRYTNLKGGFTAVSNLISNTGGLVDALVTVDYYYYYQDDKIRVHVSSVDGTNAFAPGEHVLNYAFWYSV